MCEQSVLPQAGAELVQMGTQPWGLPCWHGAQRGQAGLGANWGDWLHQWRTLAVLEGSSGCPGEQPHAQHVLSRDTEIGTVVTRGSSSGSCRDVSPSPVLHFH